MKWGSRPTCFTKNEGKGTSVATFPGGVPVQVPLKNPTNHLHCLTHLCYTNKMLTTLLIAAWCLIPPGIGHIMAPVATKYIPKFLNIPVDMNIKLFGKPLLGEHKTVRGFLVAIVTSEIVYLILIYLFNFQPISNISIYFGCISGAASMFVDSIKSLFKRQLNIAPGVPWVPFDQLDWVLGTYIVYSCVKGANLQLFIVMMVCGLVAHLITKFIGHLVGINKSSI